MFFMRALACAFLAHLFFVCSLVQAMDAGITATQLPPNGAILNQVVQEVKEFIDSQAGFTEDRVDYYKQSLEKLTIFKRQQRCNTNLKEKLSELERFFKNNLEINQTNQQSSLSYQQAIRLYPTCKMEDICFLTGLGTQFQTFLSFNGSEEENNRLRLADAIIDSQLACADLSDVPHVNSLFHQVYAYFALQEKANEFSKVIFLSNLLDKYVRSYSSFLISRQIRRSYGQHLPSTKSEDWDNLNASDRAKVETSCTNFANALKPLGIIYKALQQLSGGQDPSYIITDNAKKVISVSPILQMYLQGTELEDLNPDTFIQDGEEIIKLDLPIVTQVQEALVKKLAPAKVSPSSSPLQKPAIRQERRALQRKHKKRQHTNEFARTVAATASTSTSTAQTKSVSLTSASTLAVKSSPLLPLQEKSATSSSSITMQQTSSVPLLKSEPDLLSQEDSKSVKDTDKAPNQPITSEVLASSLSLSSKIPEEKRTSSSSQDVQETVKSSTPKPKRWRGDIIERKGQKAQLHQLIEQVDKIDLKQSEKGLSKDSGSMEEGTTLKATALLDMYALTRKDMQVVELLLDNKTHPDTITRKRFLHLLENLKVVATPTTGSIYNLYYLTPNGQRITKVMHIWDTLGRNMMKRARFVLKTFGFLAE